MGDNIQVNSELEEQLKLTNLPPEICEHICQMLPSLSLYSLPTISNEFATFANKEMMLRHKKVTVFIQNVENLMLNVCF